MMAQPFPTHAGVGPGHPGLPHGHPMAGVQHPGAGHMGGQPGPGMMQGMHPGVSGPQVSQGPMMAGMPHGAVTSGPGGPMQNAHAMAHLGPGQPNPMFQQQNPQAHFSQMTPQQTQIMRQRQHMMHQMQMTQQQQQQQQQQGMPGMMQNGGQGFSQAQLAQFKAGMSMPIQQQMHLQAQANAQVHNLQQQQQQQRMMAQHQQQQQMIQAQQQQQQQQQRNASQQMQLSRSQEQSTQPPQSHPTPAPQNPAQLQQQSTPQAQAQAAQAKQQQGQPPNSQQQQIQQQPQQNNQSADQSAAPTQPQIKQQDMGSNMAVLEEPMNEVFSDSNLKGHGILRLLSFQEQLFNPEQDRSHYLDYWEFFVQEYFSPVGVVRQQLYNPKTGSDKSYQVQFASLARFYHAHFTSGIRKIRMEPIGYLETKLPHGGSTVSSTSTNITYIYDNDIRVTTRGSIQCNFDMANRIEHLSVNTRGWTEYLPRSLWPLPESPDQKQSPKMSKNQKRPQPKTAPAPAALPSSGIGDHGLPTYIIQFLEIAEVMMVMGPLMEYSQGHPGMRPQDAMQRMVAETAHNMSAQNHMVARLNGQIAVNPGQRTPGLNGPGQFASPGMAHLGLPGQGSPHIGGSAHTPSPAHMQQGGIAMVHQMSQHSGSQGASTNTSPNVTNKRRRASQVKLEEENASQEMNGGGAKITKPSPRMGKRQKGQA